MRPVGKENSFFFRVKRKSKGLKSRKIGAGTGLNAPNFWEWIDSSKSNRRSEMGL
jgi:hypothetical protein